MHWWFMSQANILTVYCALLHWLSTDKECFLINKINCFTASICGSTCQKKHSQFLVTWKHKPHRKNETVVSSFSNRPFVNVPWCIRFGGKYILYRFLQAWRRFQILGPNPGELWGLYANSVSCGYFINNEYDIPHQKTTVCLWTWITATTCSP